MRFRVDPGCEAVSAVLQRAGLLPCLPDQAPDCYWCDLALLRTSHCADARCASRSEHNSTAVDQAAVATYIHNAAELLSWKSGLAVLQRVTTESLTLLTLVMLLATTQTSLAAGYCCCRAQLLTALCCSSSLSRLAPRWPSSLLHVSQYHLSHAAALLQTVVAQAWKSQKADRLPGALHTLVFERCGTAVW